MLLAGNNALKNNIPNLKDEIASCYFSPQTVFRVNSRPHVLLLYARIILFGSQLSVYTYAADNLFLSFYCSSVLYDIPNIATTALIYQNYPNEMSNLCTNSEQTQNERNVCNHPGGYPSEQHD